MKILILQLARLGDIYMSWPAMRALRRTYPDAEIHLLTRPRFEAAVQGVGVLDAHWTLPSSHILSPLIQDDSDVSLALSRMRDFATELQQYNYDWIINFTFSPFSSYLSRAVAQPHSKVSGYTRHEDGSLALNDEISAYFYAQVGVGKANRVHIADILASLVDVTYIEEDWTAPQLAMSGLELPEEFITVHIGASEAHKSLAADTWARSLKYFCEHNSEMKLVLIGSLSEKPQADHIKLQLPSERVIDLVGSTQIPDLFGILLRTQFLVGCDSAPMHMASLVDAPSLNVSLGNVNFWETGPKAGLSFIYRVANEAQLHPERLGEIMTSLLQGHVPGDLIVRAAGMTSYQAPEESAQRFQWDLVKAIYMGGEYPLAERMEILQGAMKLQEINSFALEQLAQVPQRGVEFAAPFLARAEEIIESISQWVPELCPLISWYQAEKVRIGPGSQEEVLAATMNVHRALGRHVKVYVPQDELMEEGAGDGAL